jgi:hypothetical protein
MLREPQHEREDLNQEFKYLAVRPERVEGRMAIFFSRPQSARSKELWIKKYSDLCELCASAVKGDLKVSDLVLRISDLVN